MSDRPCLICGSEADPDRGWLKSPHDTDERVFWLCSRCLDLADFAIDWGADEPVAREKYPPRRLRSFGTTTASDAEERRRYDEFARAYAHWTSSG